MYMLGDAVAPNGKARATLEGCCSLRFGPERGPFSVNVACRENPNISSANNEAPFNFETSDSQFAKCADCEPAKSSGLSSSYRDPPRARARGGGRLSRGTRDRLEQRRHRLQLHLQHRRELHGPDAGILSGQGRTVRHVRMPVTTGCDGSGHSTRTLPIHDVHDLVAAGARELRPTPRVMSTHTALVQALPSPTIAARIVADPAVRGPWLDAAIAGAAIGASVTALWLWHRHRHPAVDVAPWLHPNGAGVGISAGF